MRVAALAFLGLLLAAAPARAAAWAAAGRSFTDEASGVRITLPAAWDLVPRAVYPGIVATFAHPQGGRITLAIQGLAAAGDPRSQAATAARRLAAAGVAVGPPQPRPDGGWEILGGVRGRAQSLRQVYRSFDRWAVVLTMACPSAVLADRQRDWERALSSLRGPAAATQPASR